MIMSADIGSSCHIFFETTAMLVSGQDRNRNKILKDSTLAYSSLMLIKSISSMPYLK